MKRILPLALVTFRLILGPIALACALAGMPRWVYPPILVAGTLSDIFDGVLARRLGVSTPALRRYDSITDLIYYAFILAATWLICRPILAQNWIAIVFILACEAASILVCGLKFRTYPATHSYLAKFFGLCLLAAFIVLLGFNAGSWVIVALAAVALVTNLEIVAIHLLMRRPPVDVKSILALPRQQT